MTVIVHGVLENPGGIGPAENMDSLFMVIGDVQAKPQVVDVFYVNTAIGPKKIIDQTGVVSDGIIRTRHIKHRNCPTPEKRQIHVIGVSHVVPVDPVSVGGHIAAPHLDGIEQVVARTGGGYKIAVHLCDIETRITASQIKTELTECIGRHAIVVVADNSDYVI